MFAYKESPVLNINNLVQDRVYQINIKLYFTSRTM